MVTVGRGTTVTITVSVSIHPKPSVTVTMYVVVVFGNAIGLAMFGLVKLPAGDHV